MAMKGRAEKGRIQWAALAQAISMLLVVLHHCVPHGYDGPQGLLAMLDAIRYPALVCFFLTSGLFAARWRQRGWAGYVKARFLRLMTPYFCVNLLMLAPRYVAARAMGSKFRLTAGWLALSFLDPHGQGIAPHLWFLPTLFLMALLLPALDAAAQRGRPVRWGTAAALLALSAWPTAAPTLLCLNEIRLYLAWYYIGLALAREGRAERPLPGRAALPAGLLGLAVFILALTRAQAALAPMAFMAGGGLALVSLCQGMGERGKGLTEGLRDRTFTIYILSLCVQNLVEVLGYAARLPWFVTALAMLAAGLIAPWLIYGLADRLDARKSVVRFLRRMIGMRAA